jgi:hypothetical protein
VAAVVEVVEASAAAATVVEVAGAEIATEASAAAATDVDVTASGACPQATTAGADSSAAVVMLATVVLPSPKVNC